MKTILITAVLALGAALFVAPAAQANGPTVTTKEALCLQAFNTGYGSNGLANFESPQRGTIENQFIWFRALRGDASQVITYVPVTASWATRVGSGGYVHCTKPGIWQHVTSPYGTDEMDPYWWVAYQDVPGGWQGTAYGTNGRSCKNTVTGPWDNGCSVLSSPPG